MTFNEAGRDSDARVTNSYYPEAPTRAAMSGVYTATGELKSKTAGSTFKWSPLA